MTKLIRSKYLLAHCKHSILTGLQKYLVAWEKIMLVRILHTFIACSCLAVSSASAAKIEITRQIPVDKTFGGSDITGGGGFSGGFEIRMKVIDANGNLELCGALVYTNAQTRQAYRSFLRDSYFVVNGKRAIKGFHYFNNAKHVDKIDSALANCRSLGVKTPKTKPKFRIDWSTRTYRID